MQKIGILFRDVAHDPATAIAIGSAFMAAANGGTEGIYLNIAAPVVVAGLRGYESWSGRERGLPFLALSLVNFGTGASIGGHAYWDHGWSSEFYPKALITCTYGFSGLRSSLLSWHQYRGTKPQSVAGDPQFYQGLACYGATRLDKVFADPLTHVQHVIPVALASVGLARSFIKRKADEGSFLMQHYTSARAYAAQYAWSIFTSGDWKQAVGFGLWSWGLSRFDKDLNKQLRSDLHASFQQGP